MALLASFQKHTLTLAAGDAEERASLGSVTANKCVPFFTRRFSTVPSPATSAPQSSLDVYIDTGTSEVVAVTNSGSTRAQVVEVGVAEFSSSANVYAGTFSIANAASSNTATIPQSVTQSRAFALASYQSTYSSTNYPSWAVRTRFTADNQLTFSRGASTETISGHWYVVEATSSSIFTVQAFNIDVDGASLDQAITAVADTAKTMIIGSWETTGVSDNPNDRPYAHLLDSDTLSIVRIGTSGIATVTAYIIELKGAESVRRGVHTQSGQDDDDAITISAVTSTANSMGRTAIYPVMHNAVMNTTSGAGHPDGSAGLNLESTTSLRFRRSINDTTPPTDWRCAWEVIEWDIGGAPPARRVFVVT
jgi:hypothetical protein